ncbi:MAG TPA: GNAT family N-acetyltransferase [Acetobacteraceae bacterium]|nr:GNAT family N-acetyltransferase [Acetobacteraceae bacterium]
MGDVRIDVLRAGDIDGVLALQEANQVEHGGTLSARMPRTFFAAALGGMPVIVARRNGRLVGFLVSAPKQPMPEAPVVRAMLRAWPGADDAYVYGPVCVAADERGHGLAGAMFAALHALLPGREGVLFIRSDNTASIRAHAKMGMRQVAAFEHGGAAMLVLAYPG